jgi:trans-aconitate 2-methyltransferase
VPTWDPDQYLRFERERKLPCQDLIARIGTALPQTIIDLGCGTGTSTALLRDRWPAAEIAGLDSSPEMLSAARKAGLRVEWLEGDLRTWTATHPYDLVFSNAALHWIPDHAELLPRLIRQVATSGILAVQMPTNSESPAHQCIRAVAERARWKPRWPARGPSPRVGSPSEYYDLLAPSCSRVEVWQTEYFHVVPDAAAIVEWVKGTTLRPYLDALSVPEDREAFLSEIEAGVREAYPPQTDGRVLFPFRRLFFVAVR